MSINKRPMPGEPGRYHLQVFDRDARRYSTHYCDGSYDSIYDLMHAAQTAIEDRWVSSVLIRDTEQCN
jgi:hypothetical protein